MPMTMRFACTLLLAAAALSAAAADQAGGKRDDAVSEKLGIKLGVQCYTYRALTFFETVDKAVMLGLRYVESYPGQKVRPGANDTMARKALSEDLDQAILKKLHDSGVR